MEQPQLKLLLAHKRSGKADVHNHSLHTVASPPSTILIGGYRHTQSGQILDEGCNSGRSSFIQCLTVLLCLPSVCSGQGLVFPRPLLKVSHRHIYRICRTRARPARGLNPGLANPRTTPRTPAPPPKYHRTGFCAVTNLRIKRLRILYRLRARKNEPRASPGGLMGLTPCRHIGSLKGLFEGRGGGCPRGVGALFWPHRVWFWDAHLRPATAGQTLQLGPCFSWSCWVRAFPDHGLPMANLREGPRREHTRRQSRPLLAFVARCESKQTRGMIKPPVLKS